jgi:Flp pilus assembly pilin Flp
MQFIKRFLVEDEGAEVVEWALLVVVLGLAIVAGGPTLQAGIQNGLGGIGGKVNSNASVMPVAG